MILPDCGSAFGSAEFSDFVKENYIREVKTAVASSQANGQAVRVNGVIKPMCYSS